MFPMAIMLRTITLCFVFGLAFLTAQTASAQDTVSIDSQANKCVDMECEFLIVEPATQEAHPFLFLGKVVDEEHPKYRDYRRSISRYPNVLSCLAHEEAKSTAPNLLNLDWRKPYRKSDLEVCLFRTATSIGNIMKLEEWMKFHEFSFSGLNDLHSQQYEPRFPNDPMKLITAFWRVETYREKRNPSLIVSYFGYEWLQKVRLVFYFSENEAVVHVGMNASTK